MSWLALLAVTAAGSFLGPLTPASAQPPPASERPGPSSASPGGGDGYHILLLYSESRLTRSVIDADQALRSTFETRAPAPMVIYTEFLDLNSFHGASIQADLEGLLRRKYEGRPIDLIVAQGQLTVPFARQLRADLSPAVPIVFVGVEASAFVGRSGESFVTGTWRRRGWGETLDFARRVHLGLRRAVVIVGSTAGERFWLESARRQLAAAAESIEISYLVDSRFEDVLQAVAALPKGSVVLVGPFLRDGAGRDFSTPAVIARLARVARVPIYGLTEGVMGEGIVGGYVVSYEAHGRVAAELALRVLAGERPPPTGEGTTIPMFDDRQISRWKIDRRLLPADSAVLFQAPSLWRQYRGYVIGASLLVLVQMGFIAALLIQRVQRRRAQRGLAERLRFETLLSDLSRALSSCADAEIDREIDKGLRRIVEDLGTDRASLWALEDAAGESRVTHNWTRPGVPPIVPVIRQKDFPWTFAQIRTGRVLRVPTSESAIDQESLERIQTRSSALAPLVEGGVVVGGLSVGSVLKDHHWPDELLPRLRLLADVFAGALVRQRAARAARESARDIRDLAGRLMTAQEEERRRIARELHDGVNQDLAALSIALSALEDDLPEDTPMARRRELVMLQGRALELAETIRHMSHELHPGVLQYAGLAAALRSYCREFEHKHGLAVAYGADDDLGVIPADVALCLYRVTQEALTNVSRHAKASHVWVAVERTGSDLTLEIRDDGRGFDQEDARARGGLGLISLDERVRIAGGRLTIDSDPSRGTQIGVVVPCADPADSPRAS